MYTNCQAIIAMTILSTFTTEYMSTSI